MDKPKIVHWKEVPPVHPIEGNFKVRMRVLIGENDAPTYLMRVFEVDPGGVIPNHAHPWEHEIFILKGTLKLRIEDKEYIVQEGHAIYIPPNVPHEYENIGNTTAIFICTIPKQRRS